MVGKCRRAKGAVGHRFRVVQVALERRNHLLAYALHRLGIEPRLVQRQSKQFESRLGIAFKRLQVTGNVIAIGIEGEMDRLIVEGAVVGFGIVWARTLVQEAGEESRGAGAVRSVLRRTAIDRKFKCNQRNGVFFDEPCLDSTGRKDPLDSSRARGQGGFGDGCHSAHAATVSGSRNPVTARRLSSHFRAAFCTSAAVTASIRSGQRAMSSIVNPVARDAPYQRARLARFSYA